MYCKTFRTKLNHEGIEKFTQFVRTKYKPLLAKQPGFLGAYYCTKEDNEFVMIMLWEKEYNIHDWSANPDHKKIMAEMNINELFINEVFQDIYEVVETIEK